MLIYDPFLPLGLVAAKVLNIPAVATLTMTGPGVVQMAPQVQQRWESSPMALKAGKEILETYGVDVFERGGERMGKWMEMQGDEAFGATFGGSQAKKEVAKRGHFEQMSHHFLDGFRCFRHVYGVLLPGLEPGEHQPLALRGA